MGVVRSLSTVGTLKSAVERSIQRNSCVLLAQLNLNCFRSPVHFFNGKCPSTYTVLNQPKEKSVIVSNSSRELIPRSQHTARLTPITQPFKWNQLCIPYPLHSLMTTRHRRVHDPSNSHPMYLMMIKYTIITWPPPSILVTNSSSPRFSSSWARRACSPLW